MAARSSTARAGTRTPSVDAADLAAAFEHAAAGMVIADENANVLHANAALCEMLGYSREALVGKSAIALTHPDDLPVSRTQKERLERGEISSFSIEKRYLHASGRPVWVRVHVSLLTQGAQHRHLVHVVDITHERSSALLLRDAQERFREVTESIEQDFWLMGLDPLELLYSSPAATRIWGFDPMVNRDDPARIFAHIFPEDLRTFLSLFDSSIQSPNEAEYRMVRADGAVRWLRTRVFPMRDARGVPLRLGGITEDVTSRKHAELDLKQHREFERVVHMLSEEFVNLPAERLQDGFERALGRLGTLFGATRATLFLMDERTKVLEVRYSWGEPGVDTSSSPFAVYPFDPDNPIRRALARDGVVSVEDVSTLPDTIAALRDRLVGNGVCAFLTVPLLRQGQMVGAYGLSACRPTRWPPETVPRMKIVADLFSSAIERVRSEAAIRTHHDALAHALRVGTLGQLAAGIAHELNQPLASILNYVDGFEHRLAAGHVDVEQLQQGVRKIGEQALRASNVIATLRALVRKGKGTRSVHDVSELVRTALRFIEPEATSACVRVVAEHAADLPPVQVDPIQIEQVILNLVRNAVEAVRTLPEGARREIRVVTRRHSKRSIEVSVVDGGPGVAPEHAQAIFDQFYTTKTNGLGLGLSISRSIIEAHGGRLWMDPAAGPGATFRFTLSTAS